MIEKYKLLNEADRCMYVFEKNGFIYGHIIKNKTGTTPAKFMFETAKYSSVDLLKLDYPQSVSEQAE